MADFGAFEVVMVLVMVGGTGWFIWFMFDTMSLNNRVFKMRQGRCRGSGHHPNCNCANLY